MLHGQSSHQFDQAHLLLIFHFLPFLVTTETIIEMVINISVIEESKFKQLWSRPLRFYQAAHIQNPITQCYN